MKSAKKSTSTPAPQLPFAPDLGAARAWLLQLQMLNKPKAGGELLVAFQALLAAQLTWQERTALAEILSPAAAELAEVGKMSYFYAHLPYPPPLHEHMELSRQLYAALANVYTRLLADAPQGGTGAPGAATEAVWLHRALACQLDALYRTTAQYQEPERGYWRQVYVLYRLGEARGYLTQTVDDTLLCRQGGSLSSTAGGLFAQIVLFALSNAFRFTVGEMGLVAQYLYRHANTLAISERYTQNQQVALFFLNLDSDLPPQHVSRLATLEDLGNRFLFTRGVVQALLGEVPAREPASATADMLQRIVIMRLLRSLGAPELRKNKRYKDSQQEARVAIGLPSIVQELLGGDGGKKGSGTAGRKAHLFEHPMYDMDYWLLEPKDSDGVSITDERVRNEATLGGYLRGEEGSPEQRVQADWATARHTAAEREAVRLSVQVQDISLRGCGLLFPNIEDSVLCVGDLVSVRRSKNHVDLGVIRWLRDLGNHTMSAGVELLASSFDAVHVVVADGADVAEPCLFLWPNDEETTAGESLLTSNAQFKAGTSLTIRRGSALLRRRMARVIETTSSFSWFSLHGDDAAVS